MIPEITIKIPMAGQTTVGEDSLQAPGPPPTDESELMSDFSVDGSAPPGPEGLQSSAAETFAYANAPGPMDETESETVDTDTAPGPFSGDAYYAEDLSADGPAPGLDETQTEDSIPAPETEDEPAPSSPTKKSTSRSRAKK